MISFLHLKIEDASPLRRRVIEAVLRILDGHDTSLAGTIAANVMVEVIMTECPDDDLDTMDAAVDAYAAALKQGLRNCVAAKRESRP